MLLFRGNSTHFCTVCQENDLDTLYHRLTCGHVLHFTCAYDMMIHGRHYTCPICREDVVMEWLQDYEAFVQNEAESRGERQLLLTRISQVRLRHAEQNRAQVQQVPPDEPPPLAPAREEIFEIDSEGNWVLQIGQDQQILPIEPQNQQFEQLLPVRAEQIEHRQPSSLIPDRRAANRRRQERIRREQERDRALINRADERDADDEQMSSSSSSNE